MKLLSNIAKNIYGLSTHRKLIAFSVDDYGNVRIDSQKAIEYYESKGILPKSRFDVYDTLETTSDLELLFSTLCSVKDKNDKHAVFTPFALPCNLNFEAIRESNYSVFHNELLADTFSKLSDRHPNEYNNTWGLWKEGIAKGIFVPQFHGREHLNLNVFESLLRANDRVLQASIDCNSYSRIKSNGVNYTAAFAFEKDSEINEHKEILKDGISKFNQVFGYYPVHFMPPTAKISEYLFSYLSDCGIKCIDRGTFTKTSRLLPVFNYTGKKVNSLHIMVRNVVFEPTLNKASVKNALDRIRIAFKLNKPVIISSHRVNYCGLISEKNREVGIGALKQLLHSIVKEHPDVEFVQTSEIINLMK